jgi:hypothetical protein
MRSTWLINKDLLISPETPFSYDCVVPDIRRVNKALANCDVVLTIITNAMTESV